MKLKNLREWRLKHKLTQEQIGKVIGQPAISIFKIEKGTRKITPAEKMLLDSFIRMTDSSVKNDDCEFTFTVKEWAKLKTLAEKDGFSDPQKWMEAKIRAFIDLHD